MNVTSLIQKLTLAGYLQNPEKAEHDALLFQEHIEQPFYIRIISAIGAFIAAACLIGFLFISEIISDIDTAGMMVWGIVFMAIALGIDRGLKPKNRQTMGGDFALQFSFVLMWAGKILFCIGFTRNEMLGGSFSAHVWMLTLSIALVTAVTYPFYKNSADRFLSALALLSAFKMALLSDISLMPFFDKILYCLAVAYFAGAGFFMAVWSRPIFQPLAYAFVFSLLGITLLEDMLNFFVAVIPSGTELAFFKMMHTRYIFNAIYAAGLAGVLYWVGDSFEKIKKSPLIWAFPGVVLLGVAANSGILLAITLMVFGYARYDRLLTALGAIFLPVFLFQYYYGMDISLLKKSYVLLGSGVVLLGAWAVMKYMTWDKDKEVMS